MKKVLGLLAISLFVLMPVPAYAAEEVTKTYCSSVPLGANTEVVKQEILAAAKRMAINDLFGELIIANVAVEDFVVTSDQIQSSSVGFVRTKNVFYFYNSNGELCVMIRAFATAEDMARFEPLLLNKRYCDTDPSLTVSALRRLVRDEVLIQALFDYNRALEDIERVKLLRLLERVQYTEDGFLQNTETYCATMEGYVLPVAVFALLNAANAPTVTPFPTPEPSSPNNSTQRATATPTLTPNNTATRLARPTQTAAARATSVKITVEAIQEATRVQQEVEAQLTRLAPTSSPTPRSTNTSTPTPQPADTPTSTGLRVEIITDDLNIRSGPSTGYDRVGKVGTGQVLIPVGRDGANTWIQVCCINGQPGWVVNNAEYVAVVGDLSQLPVIALPTPTPRPAPVACSIVVDAELAGRWHRDEMGCPTGPAQTIWSSYTPFERGFMMWRRDTDAAYGFYSNGGWKQVADRWDGSSLAPSRGSPPPGLTVPTRGTGYVWGSDDELFHNLGWARGQQTGLCSRVQSFEKGFILRSSSTDRCHEEHQNPIRDPNFLFIEAYYTGYWRR